MIYCVTFDPHISWMPRGVLFPLGHRNYFIDDEGDCMDYRTLPLLAIDYCLVEI